MKHQETSTKSTKLKGETAPGLFPLPPTPAVVLLGIIVEA